ncbi:hypothetical protein [Maribacter orientalis]|uniref:hypothetical protein n=1 Tax=Maribacter orientalis TaxID=228957 RepID=UPI00115FA28C|nr:hypothetical protein [Maribacter orientalis]
MKVILEIGLFQNDAELRVHCVEDENFYLVNVFVTSRFNVKVGKEAGLDFSKDNRFFPFYTFLGQYIRAFI